MDEYVNRGCNWRRGSEHLMNALGSERLMSALGSEHLMITLWSEHLMVLMNWSI